MTDFIVDNSGAPSSKLLQLLEIFDIQHNKTLQSIVDATQKEWVASLRPKSKERWEIKKSVKEKFDKYHEQAMPLLCDLGLCNELVSTKQQYDYALILGSDLKGICLRLAYFLKVLSNNSTFNNVIILSGERCLAPYENIDELIIQFQNIFFIKISKSLLREFPTTEFSLIKCIVKHLNFSPSLQKKIKFINAPMQNTIRPTTGDCIKIWLQTEPTCGSILAFSDQPYCFYQHSVLKTIVPSTFTVETIGSAAQSNEDFVIFLDTLARILFQENQRQKK